MATKAQYAEILNANKDLLVYHFETDTDMVKIQNTDETLSTRLSSLGKSRTVTLSGDVSGTGTLTTATDLTITVTVTDDSHGHSGSTVTVGTASRAIVSDANKKLTVSDTTATELGYVHGVTSAIQDQLDGKAASSHGTHVTFSTTAPAAAGTAAVGTANTVARSDHVHPAQTTITGNAATATKLQSAQTLTIGNTGKSFNGSAGVTWTRAEIGCANIQSGSTEPTNQVENDLWFQTITT